MLVARFSTISALDIATDFDLANVERGAMVWQPQKVKNLRALGLGVIEQEAAAGTSRQAAVTIEPTASLALVEGYLKKTSIGCSRAAQQCSSAGQEERDGERNVKNASEEGVPGTGCRHP